MTNNTQYLNRSLEVIDKEYIGSYQIEEKGGDIPLNQLPINEFDSLGHEHLIRRFSEVIPLMYNKNYTQIEPMSKKNLRIGEFVIEELILDKSGETPYFLISNPVQKALILVCRGTKNRTEKFMDLIDTPLYLKPGNLFQVPVDKNFVNQTMFSIRNISNSTERNRYLLHQGFYTRFQNYRILLQSTIRKIFETNRFTDYSFIIVGHSLGSVLGLLHAFDFKKNLNISIDAAYLYMMPKMGSRDFVDELVETVGSEKILRINNRHDIGPHVGFYLGVHPTNVVEYYYPNNSTVAKKCTGSDDLTCSSGVNCTLWNWKDHSELGGWSFRTEFLRYSLITPTTVYSLNKFN